MFGLKKKSRKVELVSPVNGKMIRLRDVPDQVFASEMMGLELLLFPTTETYVPHAMVN